jgi:hypothetical protein
MIRCFGGLRVLEIHWEMADALTQLSPPTLSPPPAPSAPSTQESLGAAVRDADRAIGGWKDARQSVMVHLPECYVSVGTFTQRGLLLAALANDTEVLTEVGLICD